jgi:predicted RNase H-like nuclease (RuvC/YqgF family)
MKESTKKTLGFVGAIVIVLLAWKGLKCMFRKKKRCERGEEEEMEQEPLGARPQNSVQALVEYNARLAEMNAEAAKYNIMKQKLEQEQEEFKRRREYIRDTEKEVKKIDRRMKVMMKRMDSAKKMVQKFKDREQMTDANASRA